MRITALVAACLVATPAAAQEDCTQLPSPLFAPGTTDVKPFLSRVAPKLATAEGEARATIVYQPVGSCTALEYVLGDTRLTGTAVYWAGDTDADGKPVESSCTFGDDARAHVALSDVTVRTCTGADPSGGLAEFPSMVQGFGFVVPPSSSQQAITAAEAYFLLKFGGEAGREVPPWTDPAFVAIRTPASSTQLLTGLSAGVPGTAWSGNLTNISGGSGDLLAKVAAENTTGNAEATIGVLSLQRYDQSRDQVRMLAFEAHGQRCLGAVYPDSSPEAFDKQNVRDGHYDIWGYLWTIAAVDADGQPSDPRVGRFIDFVAGTTPANGADPIRDAALAGGVPACAMRVRRASDGGPIEAYEPADPCGCYFESIVGETACAACPDGDCPDGGACRFGFCEAR